MKRYVLSTLKFAIAVLLVLLGCTAFASDTLSVDTTLVSFQPDNILDVVGKAKEIIGGDVISFEAFYVYVVGASTFILGFLRNLIPKWSWLQNLNLSSIPREVTVAMLGLTVVLFIVKSGASNIDWTVLVASVFGTMGAYSFAKSLVEKIPNPTVKYLLLMILGKFQKTEN